MWSIHDNIRASLKQAREAFARSDPEWIKVKEGEADIGFAWVVPDRGWPEDIIKEPEEVPPEPAEVLKDVAGAL